MDITEINFLSSESFIDYFGNIVEHYTQCAVYLSKIRPFQDVDTLLDAASSYLEHLSDREKEQILNLHPDLAGNITNEAALTKESQCEQRAAGLGAITKEETMLLNQRNLKYKSKFGFPFIICARENKLDAILNGLETRLANPKEEEIATAFSEVKKIVSHRIRGLVAN